MMASFEDIRQIVEGKVCNDIVPKAYLLTWNPKVFVWDDYYECIEMARHGSLCLTWTVCSKNIRQGDDLFLMMLGIKEKNGIVGYGKAAGGIIKTYTSGNTKPWYIEIIVEKLCDYRTEEYPKQSMLKERYPHQCWSPQSSGILINDKYIRGMKKLLLYEKPDTKKIHARQQ